MIFSGDLKSVGDVRQLQGRMIEIHRKVKEYDGRAEIVLNTGSSAALALESLLCLKATTWKRRGATAREPSATPSETEDL